MSGKITGQIKMAKIQLGYRTKTSHSLRTTAPKARNSAVRPLRP
jgi:hypothetical protein